MGGRTGTMRRRFNWCCWLTGMEEKEEEVTKNIQPRELILDRKKIARMKERRACIILGLIMFCFILSWLPFFLLYCLSLSYPMCQHQLESSFCILDWMFSVAFWLGYSNSALNPVSCEGGKLDITLHVLFRSFTQSSMR